MHELRWYPYPARKLVDACFHPTSLPPKLTTLSHAWWQCVGPLLQPSEATYVRDIACLRLMLHSASALQMSMQWSQVHQAFCMRGLLGTGHGERGQAGPCKELSSFVPLKQAQPCFECVFPGSKGQNHVSIGIGTANL